MAVMSVTMQQTFVSLCTYNWAQNTTQNYPNIL